MATRTRLYETVLRHAEQTPSKPAICLGSETITYLDLKKQIAAWFQTLSRKSLKSIAVSHPNSVDHVAILIAGSQLGINTQVFNTDWPTALRDKLIDHLKPDAVYAAGSLRVCKSLQTTEEVGDFPFYTGFTSGSTGLPKGYARSERSWLESFAADQKAFGLSGDDIFFVPGSLSHSLPLYGVIRGLYAGATVRMQASFRPDRFIKDLKEDGRSILIGTPTQIRALIDYSLRQTDVLENLRLVLSAGSKFPTFWLDDFQSVFPTANLCEFYGSSEFSYVSYQQLTPQTNPHCVGKPFDGVDVSIRDQDGTEAAVGQIGTIYVRSPFVFAGYAGANGKLFPPRSQGGFITVGDRGFLNDTGDLSLVGREDRMFQSAGRNIQPEEIETALQTIPCIRSVAVMGEADPVRENRVVGIVKLEEDVSSSSLTLKLKKLLPPYAIPSKFYLCRDWPYTVSEKTDLAAIRAMLLGGKLMRLS
ncbi:AMP-binding protein [Sneathiella limimaris]|uniref:AMP-binding protein n=1 Tax=Sneathiella limimaris TaxID=1964213 RepID=UPI00146EC018|nr:AMP-binding protein [Sneathiella limimaris]